MGEDRNIVSHFQRYTNNNTTPLFSEGFDEITFSITRGDKDTAHNVKISRGEESNLIWCIFYSLIEQIINTLNEKDFTNRMTQKFNDLEYIFIDDPVSSLDDNHLIELAVNIADLLKSSTSDLKFIITTHNPLFYNVLFNEFKREKKTLKVTFDKMKDGTYLLEESEDSPFSYHLFLLSELEEAIVSKNIQKYHFNFLRNILEKTSTFLGYENWRELLPIDARESYYNRIINLYSHNKQHGDEIYIVKNEDKDTLEEIVNILKTIYHFKSQKNE